MRRRVTLDKLAPHRSAGIFSVRLWPCVDEARRPPPSRELDSNSASNTASEATAMTKCLLYMAPIVLIGVVATEASAAPAAWSGSMVRNIAATVPEGTGAPLVLVRGGGGRGGGGGRYRGGGRGGGSWAGAGRGNFGGGNVNRGNFGGGNVNRGNFGGGNVNRGNVRDR